MLITSAFGCAEASGFTLKNFTDALKSMKAQQFYKNVFFIITVYNILTLLGLVTSRTVVNAFGGRQPDPVSIISKTTTTS